MTQHRGRGDLRDEHDRVVGGAQRAHLVVVVNEVEWARMAAALLAESERRTAELRACLAGMQAGGPLCEVVDRL